MINLDKVFKNFRDNEIEFFTGVPDSLLNDFCMYLQNNYDISKHILSANEGNSIATAAGYHFATNKIPLVYMQNSGIGNAMNPLISLAYKEIYSIPMILLIGWRGDPSANDHIHHRLQGELTPVLLDNIEIPYRVLNDNEDDFKQNVIWAKEVASKMSSPVALIVKKGVLSVNIKKHKKYEDIKLPFTREGAMKKVIEMFSKDTIYVASTGRAARELYNIRKDNNQTQDCDVLNVGAMGHASSIALGITLGDKSKTVVCFDGDAASLMHMGSMAVNASVKESNLLHIVLNNGLHESVGGQESLGHRINFTDIATSVGYNTYGKHIVSYDELEEVIKDYKDRRGPYFIDLWIKPGIREGLPGLNVDLQKLKNDFMKKNNSGGTL